MLTADWLQHVCWYKCWLLIGCSIFVGINADCWLAVGVQSNCPASRTSDQVPNKATERNYDCRCMRGLVNWYERKNWAFYFHYSKAYVEYAGMKYSEKNCKKKPNIFHLKMDLYRFFFFGFAVRCVLWLIMDKKN